ncbi:protein RER1A-like isoform X2 [Silene latifolia]|uniref:protein RER1A-like isoform X2 n=1 Tax=Silene latifolia TaxID=37657 RepID=UPI003D784F24
MDPTSTSTSTNDEDMTSTPSALASRWHFMVTQRFQYYLDKSTPHILHRWIGLCFVAFIYAVDPEILELTDGPTLPTRGSDEFRPFVRRLPEFKFWYSITKAFCIAFVMTFFSVFDVPVFWPILLFYWFVLFTLTMRRQIQHMVKYKYVPFSFGKKRYNRKRQAAEENVSLVRD